MFPLAHNCEASLLQGLDLPPMVDALDLGHSDGDFNFDFANVGAGEILADGVLNVLECLGFGLALRSASRKTGNGNAHALF